MRESLLLVMHKVCRFPYELGDNEVPLHTVTNSNATLTTGKVATLSLSIEVVCVLLTTSVHSHVHI